MNMQPAVREPLPAVQCVLCGLLISSVMLCHGFDEQYLPDIRKHAFCCYCAVVLPVSVSKFELDQDLGRALLMKTLMDSCEFATTEAKPDTERLLKQEPCKVSH